MHTRPTFKEKEEEQGYRENHVISALVATLWVLATLSIFMAGLIGIMLGRMGAL